MTDLDVHLAAIAAGDDAAFGRWLKGAEHELRGSLRSFAAFADTESVLQETLLRVWQVAPRVVPDGRPNALLRMAFRVARNLAVDETRRLRTRRPEKLDPDRAEALAAARLTPEPDPWLVRAIRECRSKLPARPAAALSARLEGRGARSDAELADRLGMKKNTFLQNFSRARRLLAECLLGKGISIEGDAS